MTDSGFKTRPVYNSGLRVCGIWVVVLSISCFNSGRLMPGGFTTLHSETIAKRGQKLTKICFQITYITRIDCLYLCCAFAVDILKLIMSA